ncbi:MAG TPA: bifunctional oligoribonuclease/PAP phosphatase NrnA [Spirochaetales bacterium]|nr:bifunctional oligoribonuclease/PAP phosphatase NrnA [Spirochaetales bacterium]
MTHVSHSPPRELLDFLNDYSTYYVVGHKEPDGDCVGSQLALASWLGRRGKQTVLLSAGPFTRTEIASYAGRFLPKAALPPEDNAALVVLDCSSLSRVGDAAEGLDQLPLAFIDHHASGESAGEARYVVSAAPSVTCLVQKVIETSKNVPSDDEAELLLFGLCTDTGFFRHLDERSSAVFSMVSRLVDAGASPKKAFGMMNGGKPFASRKLMGELLSRTEQLFGGRLLLTWMDTADHDRYGLVGRDSDMLYQLLMTVEGIEAVVVIRQEKPGECTVGFRSRERIDVAAIAASFGGGGHRLAAGLHIRDELPSVRERVVSAFQAVFAAMDLADAQ